MLPRLPFVSRTSATSSVWVPNLRQRDRDQQTRPATRPGWGEPNPLSFFIYFHFSFIIHSRVVVTLLHCRDDFAQKHRSRLHLILDSRHPAVRQRLISNFKFLLLLFSSGPPACVVSSRRERTRPRSFLRKREPRA
ncbi:hypothetical protein LZ31DRAFT_270425 [Colletotrichum somersetense]|nr:hypothetical protein LZ31DRAFT_270425 [Colletotrichum somersetense]